jgi:hypothetical protein
MKNLIPSVLLFMIFLSLDGKIYCQGPGPDTTGIRFTKFEGEWILKDNIWKTKFGGVYQESKDTTRSFVVRAVNPTNTLLWNSYFGGGSWAVLLWTYHKETGRVNHISNTTDNNVGIGTGGFNANNDLIIKIVYPNGCTACHRIYTFHWISRDEFDFKAAIYKDNKLTDDFYGGTFLRK